MTPKTFHIGLCLAGAVSAGAYTAGVMDYLLEALAEWQRRKDAGDPDTPQQEVVISVIGGASAGGMTGIITAAALSNSLEPVVFPTDREAVVSEQPQNKLYHAWVDLLDRNMFPLLLMTDDIEPGNPIYSLINSKFIDRVANKVVTINQQQVVPLPPFIAPQLKIFTTLTNLGGFPYQLTSQSNIAYRDYHMCLHNDFACFQLNKDATVKDGWMPLDFKTGLNVAVAKEAAMATGAFPIGLASRMLHRDAEDVNNNPWLQHITMMNPVEGPKYSSQNIDGGVINNEPFENVRKVLVDITGQDDAEVYNDANRFTSTVLMVDPFPSEKPASFKSNRGLLATIGFTINTLVSQARAKSGTIASALNPFLAGQFMIAPSRTVQNKDGTEDKIQGEKAIACGGFDGFSGFVSKEFRVHDYWLGRQNCESMLRKYFVVPESALTNNPIFAAGYKEVNRSMFAVSKPEGIFYPIIPIFNKTDDAHQMPVFANGRQWPTVKEADVDQFQGLMKSRAEALLLGLVKVSGFNRFLLWSGCKIVLNRMLSNAAMKIVKEALRKHGLMSE